MEFPYDKTIYLGIPHGTPMLSGNLQMASARNGLAEVTRASQQIGWEAAWKARAWQWQGPPQVDDPKIVEFLFVPTRMMDKERE